MVHVLFTYSVLTSALCHSGTCTSFEPKSSDEILDYFFFPDSDPDHIHSSILKFLDCILLVALALCRSSKSSICDNFGWNRVIGLTRQLNYRCSAYTALSRSRGARLVGVSRACLCTDCDSAYSMHNACRPCAQPSITGLIITFGHRSFDRHKEPCGRSNSIVSGHSDRHTCMHFSTGSGQWLVVTM